MHTTKFDNKHEILQISRESHFLLLHNFGRD